MLDINYLIMKRVLLRDLKNETIYIEIKGVLSTIFFIEKARVLVNRNRIVIANENMDCTILLGQVKSAKVEVGRVELITKDSKYILST